VSGGELDGPEHPACGSAAGGEPVRGIVGSRTAVNGTDGGVFEESLLATVVGAIAGGAATAAIPGVDWRVSGSIFCSNVSIVGRVPGSSSRHGRMTDATEVGIRSQGKFAPGLMPVKLKQAVHPKL